MPRTLRLFVALHPPPEVVDAMLELLAGLGPLAPHRVVPPEQVHLTLLFLGERRERDVREIVESVDRACAGIGTITLTPGRLRTLPENRRAGAPRLVALHTDAPGPVLELQRRLASRLAGQSKRGERFTPHITLARFAHDAIAQRLDISVDLPAFTAREIALVASELHPTGARHRVLHRTQLA